MDPNLITELTKLIAQGGILAFGWYIVSSATKLRLEAMAANAKDYADREERWKAERERLHTRIDILESEIDTERHRADRHEAALADIGLIVRSTNGAFTETRNRILSVIDGAA